MATKEELRKAYEAGRDTKINKANVDNCNIKFFQSEESKNSWEEGRRDTSLGLGEQHE